MESLKNNEIIRHHVEVNQGLTTEQVEDRIQNGLLNKDKRETKVTYLQIIVRNLFTFFNMLLFSIAIVLIIFQMWTNLIFMVILLANLAIGLFQDIRAKVIVDKLTLIQKSKISVIRNGETVQLYNDELVLDDVILLKGADLVPCDSVVLEGNCSTNESILTGESDRVKKTVGDVVYSGSAVTSGEAYCRVDKIGADNYINKIQNQTKEYKGSKSQLYIQLNKIFKIISIFVVVLGVAQIIAISIGYLKTSNDFSYEAIGQYYIAPIAGAIISLIPSGMYLLASTSLTAGILSLSKKNVLVNDMYSLDTLARVDTLCIDKTGTITDGTMSVKEYFKIEKNYPVSQNFNIMMGSFNAAVNDDNFTAKALFKRFGNEAFYQKEKVLHFDSERKYSAATLKNFGTIVIGAYGFVPIEEDITIQNKIDFYSKQGERILIVGYSTKSIIDDEIIPDDLVGIAIIVVQDHIKDDAKHVLDWFKNNDVDIKVLSGDNYLTVQKIAEEVDLKNADKGISLAGISDEEVKAAATKNTVFGRVSPDQKKLIVEALKEEGHTVAMFGDGVNDILAFKASDVSISVANGASAAKDLASLILIDNMFSSLPSIVAQGRRVINNLQRTCSLFLVKTTFSIFLNLFFILFSFCGGIPWPFTTKSFYCWELAAIGVSSFLLALEPNNERIKGQFVNNIIKNALPNGVILGISIMVLYMVFVFAKPFGGNEDIYRTVATYAISLGALFVLSEVCFPLNFYRAIVMIVGFVVSIALFIWSIFGTNWLDLYPQNTSPRYLNLEQLVFVLVSSLLMLLALCSKHIINYALKVKNAKIKQGEIK